MDQWLQTNSFRKNGPGLSQLMNFYLFDEKKFRNKKMQIIQLLLPFVFLLLYTAVLPKAKVENINYFIS